MVQNGEFGGAFSEEPKQRHRSVGGKNEQRDNGAKS